MSLCGHNSMVKEKLLLKRWVFRRLQKTGRDCADMTRCGRLFQTREAATGKAWSPYVSTYDKLDHCFSLCSSLHLPHWIIYTAILRYSLYVPDSLQSVNTWIGLCCLWKGPSAKKVRPSNAHRWNLRTLPLLDWYTDASDFVGYQCCSCMADGT